MSKKTVTKLEIKVVFDTNALHTQAAQDLLNTKSKSFIERNSNHKDIRLTWLLPEVVKMERQFQMLKAGKALIPSIQKLERLLGHNLNINENILKKRVDDCIDEQLNTLNIEIAKMDTNAVNWESLIQKSVFRLLPFEDNDKEKGFRDALIFETFSQIVMNSNDDKKKCRIIMITGDNLLTKALDTTFSKRNNVKILPDIEKCEELINLLINDVNDEFLNHLNTDKKIDKYFFNGNEKNGLYYEYNVTENIKTKFKDVLNECPSPATQRENGTWYISSPIFHSKENHKFHWTSKITIEGNLYKTEFVKKDDTVHSNFNRSIDMNPLIPAYDADYFTSLLKPNSVISPSISEITQGYDNKYETRKIKIAKCQSVFEIDWHVVVKTNFVFGTSFVENIRFIETIWEEIN